MPACKIASLDISSIIKASKQLVKRSLTMRRIDKLLEAYNRIFQYHPDLAAWVLIIICLLIIFAIYPGSCLLALWLGGLLHQFLHPYFPWLPSWHDWLING